MSLITWALLDLFRSRTSLEAELLALRQQLNVLRRGAPKRRTFKVCDRLIFVLLYRIAPGILDALAIVQPENYPPLAPRRFSGFLAMEVPTATWPAEGAERNPAADPRDEPR